MNAIERAVALTGGKISRFARLLSAASGENVSAQRAWKWLKAGAAVTPELCRSIESVAAECHGEFIASGEKPPCLPPTRYELRPDVFGFEPGEDVPSHKDRAAVEE